jgi:hypothetical protein
MILIKILMSFYEDIEEKREEDVELKKKKQRTCFCPRV